MTSTINATDFDEDLVGALVRVNQRRGADFEQIYKQPSSMEVYRVVSDNKGKTQDGSGVRMIEFQNVSEIHKPTENGGYASTGELRYPEILSSNADRFDVSQDSPYFAPLEQALS